MATATMSKVYGFSNSEIKTTIFHGDSANLDFLRSLAVLLVFFSHFYDIRRGHGHPWDFSWKLGQMGVLIFFVHTCLVLMWSMERMNLTGKRLFISFYIRRFFRLYPLSITVVLLAAFFDLRWAHQNLWQNLTLTQNLFASAHGPIPPTVGPIWSLPLEVQMYIALPCFFFLFRNRSIAWLGGFWFLALCFSFFSNTESAGILRFMPCFLGGVITWRVMRNKETARFSGWFWPLVLIPVSAIWLFSKEHWVHWSIAGFGLTLALTIPFFREIPSEFVNKTTKIIARYSYGIYLSHFAIIIFIFSNPSYPMFKYIEPTAVILSHHRLLHWLVFLSLTVAIPLGLYHLIEEPGIRLGKRLARRIVTAS